ncbi:phosphate ABC transporter permease subunit PstC [Kribbella sp.]|uniref:phosphate ABC transporter permease subunit PstC n=1 Tax=Kribbella sp. TaxID=1871183 RepID=UPI002D798128|nr:phosphate ABC transporter permease subunit PstC [Kribbella sp.]
MQDPAVTEPVVPETLVPRRLRASLTLSDRIFRWVARGGGALVLLITGGIGVFLAYQAKPTLDAYGWKFFTEQSWNPEANQIGVAAVLFGTIVIATIAIAISFPVALATALFISEWAPRGLKKSLVALVDLMVAVPSIVYGLWGFFLLQPQIIHLSRWITDWFGWIPVFKVDTDPDAAIFDGATYASSAFIAGIVVAMMVMPIACAVMREVFDQTPPGEREAALALGSTSWGVVRAVVLPFGRGGIIGGTMLGLGRALGETIAVVMIVSPLFEINWHVLQSGSITISSMIALRYGEASGSQLNALMAAGLVLFIITLIVNLIAGFVVSRSRSGAGTEI